MAARRVWRRRAEGSERQGRARAPGGEARRLAGGRDAPDRGRGAAGLALDGSGGRRGGVAGAGRRGGVAVVGGCGGAAGEARRLSPRLRQDDQEIQLHIYAVRPLRGRMHPHAHHLRTEDRRRCGQVPPLHGGGLRSRRLVRRFAVGRTRGRTGEGRTAAQDVRLGRDPGVSRVQDALGPEVENEPRQGHRRTPARCRPAPRPALQPEAHREDAFPLPGGFCSPSRTRRSGALASARAASRPAAGT